VFRSAKFHVALMYAKMKSRNGSIDRMHSACTARCALYTLCASANSQSRSPPHYLRGSGSDTAP
jgi:hypothetical protein